jgi:hypothetical protein
VRIADLSPLERLFVPQWIERQSRLTWRPVNTERLPPDGHDEVRRAALRWGQQWFDDREAATWLAIGVDNPLTAAECRAADITPQMLLLPFAIPGKALHGGKLTLKKALDARAATVAEIRADLIRTGDLPGHAQAS